MIGATLFTAVLAVIVILVATQLQNKGSKPVAPNAPESLPKAVAPPSCSMTFTVAPPQVEKPGCESKTAYKDVSTNTPGNYNLDAANLLPANSQVVPGQKIVYHMKGTALEGNTIDTVFWLDILDARLTFVDSSNEDDCSHDVNDDGTTSVLCKISTDPNGGGSALYEVNIRVMVKANATLGTLNNKAYVDNQDTGVTDTTPSCSLALTIGIPGVASCTNKTAHLDDSTNSAGTYPTTTVATKNIATGSAVVRGQQFVYKLTGSPLTSAATSDVVWTDTLDSRLDFVDATAGCTHTATAPIVVTCNKGHVAVGADYSVAIRVKVKADAAVGSFTNTASVKTGTGTANTCAIPLSLGAVSCDNLCTADTDCSGGLKCSAGKCRNNACTGNADCVCTVGAGFYIIKYNDKNGDGSRQGGEPGLKWDFEWDVNGNNNWTAYQTDDANDGKGPVITLVTPGDVIRVREKGKDGWSSTTATQKSITIVAAQTSNVEFGNWQKTAAGCNNSCSTDSDCASGLSCSNGTCRNNACIAKTNCVCDVTTTSTPTAAAKATPAAPLPQSGSTSETIGTIAVGVVIAVLGIIGLFAL